MGGNKSVSDTNRVGVVDCCVQALSGDLSLHLAAVFPSFLSDQSLSIVQQPEALTNLS